MTIDRRSLIVGLGGLALGASKGFAMTASKVALASRSCRRRPDGVLVPRLGDSLLSFRFPAREIDVPLAAYRPTRIEWHYVENPDFVQRLKQQPGIGFVGGTINANPSLRDSFGYAHDFDGRPLVAPWMTASGRRWASTASAATRNYLFAWADRTIDAGCDGIQVDDGGFQWAAEEWGGGDFSPASLTGFGPWLAARVAHSQLVELGISSPENFDYRKWLRDRHGVTDKSSYRIKRLGLPLARLWTAYQANSVLSFWHDLRDHLDRRSSAIPLSLNFGRVQPTNFANAIAPLLDYTLSEIQAEDPPWRLAMAGAYAESICLPFAGCYSGSARRLALRQSIANCHASGIVPVAPWDGYVAGPNGTFGNRFFPPPNDYADLFRFAHDSASLLRGWVGGASLGVIVAMDVFPAQESYDLFAKLVTASVPFRILTVSGDLAPRRIARVNLAGLSALVLATPRAARFQAVQDMLAASGLPLINAADVTRHAIGTIRDDWRIVVRHRPNIHARTAIHMVSSKLDARPLSGKLELRMGTTFAFEKSPRRLLLRPGAAPMRITPDVGRRDALVYTLPEIESWAMLVSGPAI